MKNLNKNKHNKDNQGFTLIELLVVTIILGILSAITIPNLLKQIGKARETEAKNSVSTIVRAQQAYHFEKGEFANSVSAFGGLLSFANNNFYNSNNSLGVILTDNYYSFATMTYNVPDYGYSLDFALVIGVANDSQDDGTRNYGAGIGYSNGIYNQVLCQSPYNSTLNIRSGDLGAIDVWNYFINYTNGNVECRTPSIRIY